MTEPTHPALIDDQDLSVMFTATNIHTDGAGVHTDDAGTEYTATDVDGETTYLPAVTQDQDADLEMCLVCGEKQLKTDLDQNAICARCQAQEELRLAKLLVASRAAAATTTDYLLTDIVSTWEAAGIMRVTPSTIWRWCEKGKVKSHRTPGGRLQIVVADLLSHEA